MSAAPDQGKSFGPFPVKAPRELSVESKQDEYSTLVPANRDEIDGKVVEPPIRKYECKNYEACLGVAVSLNWPSFTCGGCCGEPDEKLFWRARQHNKKDAVGKILSDLPPVPDLVTK